MAGAVELFRWSMIGAPRPPFGMVAASCGAAFVILALAVRYFRRVEQYFADVV
jgi:lipopolysaccharide transport system permease protein